MAIGRTNTCSGSTGATLAITSPVGVTVTVSKDGKTKTKTANSAGQAVFKGLGGGIWMVTITDGERTASRQVTIISDYTAVMAFFSATINVAYPVGSVCTCSDGTTTMTAPDTSGSAVFTVSNAGAWTVTITNGAKSESKTVTIQSQNQSESVELLYSVHIVKSGVIGSIGFSTYAYRGVANTTVKDGCIEYVSKNTYTVALVADSKIDLTQFTAIRAKMDVYVSAKNNSLPASLRGASVVILSSIDNTSSSALVNAIAASAQTTVVGDGQVLTVDVSGFSGEYFVGIIVGSYNNERSKIGLYDLEVV